MRVRWPLFFALGFLALGASPVRVSAQLAGNLVAAGSSVTGSSGTNAACTYVRDVMPIMLGKCFACHNNQTRFLPDWSDYKTAYGHRWEIKRRVWDSWKGEYYKEPMPAGNSPQCLAMTEAERLTIKAWVESGATYGVPPDLSSATSRSGRMEQGARLYATLCAACHQSGGQGIPDRFPPLAGSDFLNADKERAIKILLHGCQGEIVVNGRKFNNVMPQFPLLDQDIASALTYVYNTFGNSGKEVAPEEVAALRAKKDDTPSAVRASPSPSRWE